MISQRNSGRLMDLLRHAYRATHDADAQLAVVDDTAAVVLQFIRLRLTPAEQVAEQFEQVLQQRTVVSGLVRRTACPPDELRRLRRLSTARRQELYDALMAAAGYQWRHGGWQPDVEGHGEAVEAFVYDAVTEQAVRHRGIGTHALAVYELYNLVRPSELGRRWPLTADDRHRDLLERAQHFVCGFILILPGWRTPFLHLWEKEPTLRWETWQQMASVVQQRFPFLVVQHDGQPIPFRRPRSP
ncbi:MAG: hypothetical protein HY975_00065 [Candidatus Kerfeldbacteria bacterium]|nr:hypothetical protein [Candidatus Kerfeldbacteria bacterium]